MKARGKLVYHSPYTMKKLNTTYVFIVICQRQKMHIYILLISKILKQLFHKNVGGMQNLLQINI